VPDTLIGVIDMDMGNLRSVLNAVHSLGFDHRVIRAGSELDGLSHLILPGVGNYRTAMRHLEAQSLVEPIREFAAGGRPMLGICLGMQLLSSTGDEGETGPGLGLIEGHVERFDPMLVPSIPHVGWNEVRLTRKHPVLAKVKSGVDFYFVHSFHFRCAEPADALGLAEYGGREYTAIVARANVLGFQFHPEKSQNNGLKLLENFCDWDGAC
jgi:glutamine amidotransferase